jgi:hypothetical protein
MNPNKVVNAYLPTKNLRLGVPRGLEFAEGLDQLSDRKFIKTYTSMVGSGISGGCSRKVRNVPTQMQNIFDARPSNRRRDVIQSRHDSECLEGTGYG